MPKYMDQHSMKPFKPEQFRELQKAPADEFGVTHHEIFSARKTTKHGASLMLLTEQLLRSTMRRRKLRPTGFMR